MQDLTPEGRRVVETIAQRHGVSVEAALSLLRALVAGHGAMAQFSHPELGGMGQWTQGGMTMVGNMFDHGLKARVDALCTDLAALLRGQPVLAAARPAQSQAQSQSGTGPGVSLFIPATGSPSGAWWPAELGDPSSAGAQNDLRYAFFPAARRLAIQKGGRMTLYDTGDHLISGVSQQQSGDQTLTLTSQRGLVRLSDLPVVGAGGPSPAPHVERPAVDQSAPAARAERPTRQAAVDRPAPPRPPTAASPVGAPASVPADRSSEDVFDKIERLAELHRKGILTEEEFTAKKAELLGRI